jgi:hypothetical protein
VEVAHPTASREVDKQYLANLKCSGENPGEEMEVEGRRKRRTSRGRVATRSDQQNIGAPQRASIKEY